MKKKILKSMLVMCIFAFMLSGCASEVEMMEVHSVTTEAISEEVVDLDTISEDMISEDYTTECYDEIIDISSNSDLSVAKVGDVVKFGRYEQDADLENGPEAIEWIVLDEQDGKLLLMSQYALEYLPFHVTQSSSELENITWENSTLRKWMNETFYNEAFALQEQEMICLSELENSVIYTEEYGHVYSNTVVECYGTTQDKVFLLDYQELIQYMNISDKEFTYYYDYYNEMIYTGDSYLGIEDFSFTSTEWAYLWMHEVYQTNSRVWYRTNAKLDNGETLENGMLEISGEHLYVNTDINLSGSIYPTIWVEK